MEPVKQPVSIFTMLITGVIVIVSIVLLYLVNNFLYGSSSSNGTKVISTQITGNTAQTNLPAVRGLYEGGDYAVSMWVYINSYNINRNKRKHLFEISGPNFSTLLIALGAFKNTLMVRTHSRDNETVVVGSSAITSSVSSTSKSLGPTGPTGTTGTSNLYNIGSTGPTGPTGPKKYYGSGANVNQDILRSQFMKEMEGNMNDTAGPAFSFDATDGFQNETDATEGFQNATPASNDATRQDGSLTPADLNALFTSLAMDDSLINPTQICDIPSIDMQRWVNITVVISGRTIDVYMDGKLVRSCVTRSYYKVDPTGTSLKIADRGGFDGYINTVTTYNNPLSPADIYHIYQAGPTGTSAGVGSMMTSLFTGK